MLPMYIDQGAEWEKDTPKRKISRLLTDGVKNSKSGNHSFSANGSALMGWFKKTQQV